ncbi:MAG TPA: glycogen/starch synthase [Polyangiaceae bacterium]
MDILMVSAELSPYARASETADAVASLAKALRQLGHEVTVALPRYKSLESSGLMAARRLTPLALSSGAEVTVYDGQLPSGVKLVLFDAPVLFDRPGIFGEDGQDYPDNAKRFGLLCEAAAALLRQRAQQAKAFDILHVHDWPAALVPVLLRTTGPSVPSVLTIHDVSRQGIFPNKDLDALGVPAELVEEALKLGGKINMLKAGVSFADAITSVSAAYTAELSSAERAGALAEVISASGKPLIGIANGLDYGVYNPATDPALVSRYDAEDASNKARSKVAMLRECNLELDSGAPLVAVVGDADKERGLDLAAAALPHLLKNPVSVVFAVRGRARFIEKAATLAQTNADVLCLVRDYTDAQRHRMLAAADILLHTGRHEPSGAGAMAAHRYGALPVAFATGGVLDVVVDCDAGLETGTGFLFEAMTQKELIGGVARALAAYASPAWPRLVRRVMRLDHNWDRPARRYLQVYRQTLGANA